MYYNERPIYIKRSKKPTPEERARWFIQDEIEALVLTKKTIPGESWEIINLRIIELNKEYFKLGGVLDLQW
jgi:hypothetical protein